MYYPYSVSKFIFVGYVGLFSYMQVSFHICGSLFKYVGLTRVRQPLTLSHVLSVFGIQIHTCRICRSLFIYVGLFSYIQVSFHTCRSLFIYVSLFSYIQVSFHICGSHKSQTATNFVICILSVFDIHIHIYRICRSLFICVGFFSYTWVSFHICRSLFIYVGHFLYMWVTFYIYSSLFIYLGLFSYMWVSQASDSYQLCHICMISVFGIHIHI